ncbi:MAG: prolyl oligopeptidase family serine peptidase [Candidatus Endonucleobacter sp. (ex Gigantidas childressi)]|nr:prolyl oligopeptidase family serine peptidase [Candidatus Endonucleobacter sp. (ex Gigantidas childressi)]
MNVFQLPLLAAVGLIFLSSCSHHFLAKNKHHGGVMVDSFEYPETKKVTIYDQYFNTSVADPYRWLEDDMSNETASWVLAQNKLTFEYLKAIPYRDNIRDRIKQLWNYEKEGAPFKEGKYTYFHKNDGLQNQYVIYRSIDDGKPEVFLDPNTFSVDGSTSLANISFSEDGSLVAYSISEGGSDWRKIIVIDAVTKQVIDEPLVDVKFSGMSWKGQEGFFYSKYDKQGGSGLSAKLDQQKLYFHKVKTSQEQDNVVFGATPEQKRRYISGGVTEDGRYLIIYCSVSTTGSELYLKDLSKPDAPFVTILDKTDSDTYVIDSVGTKLYLVTNRGAPNKKIVMVDVNNPEPINWLDIIPETEHVLSISVGGGYLFAEYMIDALSKVYQYDYEGKKIREIALPGDGSVSVFSEKRKAQKLYYTFTNYTTPETIFELDLQKQQSSVYRKSAAKFDSTAYVSEQVFYTSKDGTKIPMMITHKKGIVMDGNNPTILYGYGGFNVSLTPSFQIANAFWLEQGGVYAVPNLRGGGEYGVHWHNAGIKLNKQNVFDDFIAAAEYLIKSDYTSSDFLAISGGSNGGLLVGAVMTQKPQLAKVALPTVGVLDMLRYHTFTVGAGWAYDYGTAEQSKEMFEYLKGYSPVHNVVKETRYPATLVITGDHDDRVVPAHSFKFAAHLQDKNVGQNPMLIRVETNAGHGAGTPVSKSIELYADLFAFTLFNMELKTLPYSNSSNYAE